MDSRDSGIPKVRNFGIQAKTPGNPNAGKFWTKGYRISDLSSTISTISESLNSDIPESLSPERTSGMPRMNCGNPVNPEFRIHRNSRKDTENFGLLAFRNVFWSSTNRYINLQFIKSILTTHGPRKGQWYQLSDYSLASTVWLLIWFMWTFYRKIGWLILIPLATSWTWI